MAASTQIPLFDAARDARAAAFAAWFQARWDQPLAAWADAARARIADEPVVVSVSGGKDSTACCILLQAAGIPFRGLHLDTGWEHEDTEAYVRTYLPAAVGFPLDIAGFPGGMEALIRQRGMHPNRQIRFCTDELKVAPAQEYLSRLIAAGHDPVNVVGIRREEGATGNDRGDAVEWDRSATFDCAVWRPLVAWTLDDVIEAHRLWGVRPNPLYLRGARRVGCWPCIFIDKAEARLLAETDPGRIARLRALEAEVAEVARARELARTEAAFAILSAGGTAGAVDAAMRGRGGTRNTLDRMLARIDRVLAGETTDLLDGWHPPAWFQARISTCTATDEFRCNGRRCGGKFTLPPVDGGPADWRHEHADARARLDAGEVAAMLDGWLGAALGAETAAALRPGGSAHVVGCPVPSWRRHVVRSGEPWPIDRVVAWARTARGGRTPAGAAEPFVAREHERGCARWGLCDVPAERGAVARWAAPEAGGGDDGGDGRGGIVVAPPSAVPPPAAPVEPLAAFPPGGTILEADCVAAMAAMPEASVGAVVTDPPYGLEFMNEAWDDLSTPARWQFSGRMMAVGLGGQPNPFPRFSSPDPAGAANATCSTCGGRMRGKKRCTCADPRWVVKGKSVGPGGGVLRGISTGGGGMNPLGFGDRSAATPSFGKVWANRRCVRCGHIASGASPCTCDEPEWEIERGDPAAPGRTMQTSHVRWLREARRVLAPDAPLYAFSGSRTFHRLAAAMAEAFGDDVRINLRAWAYASGFPKSLNVGRAIDKANPVDAATLVPEAQPWAAWGTALKPAWEPILCIRKDGEEPPTGLRVVHVLRKPLGQGTVVANVLRHGTGALHIDACRVARAVPTATQEVGGARGRLEPIAARGVADSPLGGWPSNLVLIHRPGCRVEGTMAVRGSYVAKPYASDAKWSVFGGGLANSRPNRGHGNPDGTETIPRWICEPGCAVAAWDAVNGIEKSGRVRLEGFVGAVVESPSMGAMRSRIDPATVKGDAGPVSRFFNAFGGPTGSDDLVAHLRRLIDPRWIVPEAAVLDGVQGPLGAWRSAPAGSLGGLVLQSSGIQLGDSLDALAADACAVLRPGAHVLLVAPDDEPLGWRGACAFEDAGFTVRDAILVLDGGAVDPTRLPIHYCPKAPTAERWALRACEAAGCGWFAVEPAATARRALKAIPCPQCGVPVGRIEHPTRKPRALMRRLLRQAVAGCGTTTTAGARGALAAGLAPPVPLPTVLDPFLGTGTTLEAAALEGVQAVGVERDPRYAAMARAALAAAQAAGAPGGAASRVGAPQASRHRASRPAAHAAHTAPPTLPPAPRPPAPPVPPGALRILDLFAGAGLAALGLHRAGLHHVGFVERDAFCRSILRRHWPAIPQWGDATTLDPAELPDADVWWASPPCQSASHAGSRKGRADDRWLWPEVFRLVAARLPGVVLAENVPGLLSVDRGRAFREVLHGFYRLGYVVEWKCMAAAHLGAPHRRDRVWIVARRDGRRTWEREEGAAAKVVGNARMKWPRAGRWDGRLWPRESRFPLLRSGEWPWEVAMGEATLPTPCAGLPNDGEDPSQWEARRAELARRHGNNGAGTPLAIAAKLLATPRAEDAESSGARHSRGVADTLTAQARSLPTPGSGTRARGGRQSSLPALLPTPQAYSHGDSAAPGTTILDRAVRGMTEGGDRRRRSLLPTPNARDEKGQDIPGRHGTPSLPQAVGAVGAGRLLAPDLHEWMMGVPEGWSLPDGPSLLGAPSRPWTDPLPRDRWLTDVRPLRRPRLRATGNGVVVACAEWLAREVLASLPQAETAEVGSIVAGAVRIVPPAPTAPTERWAPEARRERRICTSCGHEGPIATDFGFRRCHVKAKTSGNPSAPETPTTIRSQPQCRYCRFGRGPWLERAAGAVDAPTPTAPQPVGARAPTPTLAAG